MILSHKIVHINSVLNFIKTRSSAFFKSGRIFYLCYYILEVFSIIAGYRQGLILLKD